jgi:hypothetical protein
MEGKFRYYNQAPGIRKMAVNAAAFCFCQVLIALLFLYAVAVIPAIL